MSVSSHFLTTSAPECLMLAMKPGCRGDPRMNRAVDAKLKNPHLALFDALAIGGFTYPRNVDAATMDNDRVTLGQRKNQLNRRLRLARQNLEKRKGGSKAKASAAPKKPAVSGTSPLVIANSYLRQARRGKTATKRAAPEQQSKSKKQCLATTVVPNPTSSLPSSSPFSLNNALSQNAFAKHQTGTVSPLLDEDSILASLTNTPSASATVTVYTNTDVNPSNTCFWPTTTANGNLALLNLPQQVEASSQANLVVADFASGITEQQNQMVTVVGLLPQNNVVNSTRTVSTSSFTAAEEPQMLVQQQQDNDGQIAGDIIRQQQVVPEQQQQQVVQVVPEPAQDREDIALRMFTAGLQDLYKKSMVAAGFAPQDAGDRSPTFHRFAFQAWKNECERLQDIMKDHVDAEQQSTGYP